MRSNSSEMALKDSAFFRLALGSAVLLLIPLIAMGFTSQVDWSLADFMVMGLLLFGSGSLCIAVSRRLERKYVALAITLITALLLYVWAELAVGLFFTFGS